MYRKAAPRTRVPARLAMRPLRCRALADAGAIIAVRLLVRRTSVMAKPFLISKRVPAGGHAASLVLTKKYEPMRTPKKITSAPRNVQIPSFMFGRSEERRVGKECRSR